jgi:hypothetical protein
MAKRYAGDPYWTTARFDSTDQDGQPVKRGDRIFYYPRTKTVLTGAKAETASREFEAAAEDEELYGNQYFADRA